MRSFCIPLFNSIIKIWCLFWVYIISQPGVQFEGSVTTSSQLLPCFHRAGLEILDEVQTTLCAPSHCGRTRIRNSPWSSPSSPGVTNPERAIRTHPGSRYEVPPVGRNLLGISYGTGPLEILAHKKVLRHLWLSRWLTRFSFIFKRDSHYLKT